MGLFAEDLARPQIKATGKGRNPLEHDSIGLRNSGIPYA
jgi:hypothetical protein